jgi:hypothetical protein
VNSSKAPGLYRIKIRGDLRLLSGTIDQDFEIRIIEPSYPSFLPEPPIAEIIEVIAGLQKEI